MVVKKQICYNEAMIDHDTKALADKITAIGALEHIYFHAKKSASTKVEDEELSAFFQIIASMAKSFRRRYTAKHFPNCPDELWCLGKAVEEARQRIYESDDSDTEDLADIDAIWALIWNRITGVDVSGCSSCKEDRGDSGVIKDEDWGDRV